ncbi:DUF2510 domain-containing protein [Mycolicibacterium sp. 624]|uniref:DUF2510 domain-containing protein n=1 Tax=Mycolicibacterium sp. 624 TaxID=3156314 RepID=UPI003399273D
MTTPSVPAGWYSDPDDPQALRYWDGTAWTAGPVAEQAAPEVTQPERQPSLEPVGLELPVFESFETPSFESISSGPAETPATPPAADATPAPEAPESFDEPGTPTPTDAPTTTAGPHPEFQTPPWESPTTAVPLFTPRYDAPPPNPPAGTDNRRLIIGFLSAVGALLLILILVLVYALVIRDDAVPDVTPSPTSASAAPSAESTTSAASETPTEAVAAPAAGEIVDGPFTISVASTERGDTISSTVNESLEKTAVGEFLVVYLNVGNTSGDVQEFLSNLQVLNTDAGTIAPDDEASLYLGGGVVIVSPGETLETAVVFDVPVGTVASGIIVHGVPGMAGGELPVE